MLIAFEETTKIVPELIAKGIGPQDQQIYFVDGNTADYSKDFPGRSRASRATHPGAELPVDDFKRPMLKIDPKLEDFTYAGESYDAVILIALAAIAGRPTTRRRSRRRSSTSRSEGTKCTTFQECSDLLKTARTSTTRASPARSTSDDTGADQGDHRHLPVRRRQHVQPT